MPDWISHCKGRILMVNAMKRMRMSADKDIIFPWLRLRRNPPRFLRPSVKRSFDSFSLIPNVSHLFILVYGVFYLMLRLAVANYHISGLFMLSPKSRRGSRRKAPTRIWWRG